ncbi:anti-sigma factor family protein [Sanguibacter antarcticus]|uniref:Putative zinc finger protein n=1 Tax=Sanguibacter antarcticus TaxID=372484 RepID=A0A2A9E456_9MICO|nr:zf-HC2 domain-containing protein [Sanguibacter antarcticus]PFG33738.1 putative zinc finger protein [Sanguibacter antarcticus]
MSPHLGSQVSALVDGQLDAAARDRALVHVAGCSRCAGDLVAARDARQSLRGQLTEVLPAPELVSRLLALSVDDGPGAQRIPCPPGASSSWSGEDLPPRSLALCGDLRDGGLPRWARAGALSALAVTGIAAAGLFVLGARPVVVPSRATTDALSVLASAPLPLRSTDGPAPVVLEIPTSVGAAPTDDVFGWLGEHGWERPATLPDGVRLTQVRFAGDNDGILEVDLESPLGRVVVREQKGRLDSTALDGTAQSIGGNPVYVVSETPVHLVWQSSDTVIDVVSEMDLEDVLQLVSTFTVDEFDTGFQARVERGWSTLTGVL